MLATLLLSLTAPVPGPQEFPGIIWPQDMTRLGGIVVFRAGSLGIPRREQRLDEDALVTSLVDDDPSLMDIQMFEGLGWRDRHIYFSTALGPMSSDGLAPGVPIWPAGAALFGSLFRMAATPSHLFVFEEGFAASSGQPTLRLTMTNGIGASMESVEVSPVTTASPAIENAPTVFGIGCSSC